MAKQYNGAYVLSNGFLYKGIIPFKLSRHHIMYESGEVHYDQKEDGSEVETDYCDARVILAKCGWKKFILIICDRGEPKEVYSITKPIGVTARCQYLDIDEEHRHVHVEFPNDREASTIAEILSYAK